MAAKGKTIRSFLVDGTPAGIVIAEVITLSSQIISFPRSQLLEALNRKDVTGKTGIYFLIGAEALEVYVGKSDNIDVRLNQHAKDETKGFFEHIVVFISKDQNMTLGHASYLEFRVIDVIKSTGLSRLKNGNQGSRVHLPESEECDMENLLEHLKILMPAIGFNFLRETPDRPTSDSKSEGDLSHADVIFVLAKPADSVLAKAFESDGLFVVLKGSTARHPDKAAPSCTPTYRKLIENLMENQKLVSIDDTKTLLRFAEDVAFTSPSGASDIVCGSCTNGRKTWKTEKDGKTYQEWFEEQLT